MTRVALVRHGETDWNRDRRLQGRTDIPLNEMGRDQAYQVARLLGRSRWSLVLSSPLVRARATAQIISDVTGIPLGEPILELIERSYGRAEGSIVSDAHTLWPDGCYPDSESMDALAERGDNCVRDISTRHSGGVVLVSHGALIRGAMTRLTGHPTPRILNGGMAVLTQRSGTWIMDDA